LIEAIGISQDFVEFCRVTIATLPVRSISKLIAFLYVRGLPLKLEFGVVVPPTMDQSNCEIFYRN
jgi:hypothetical protein